MPSILTTSTELLPTCGEWLTASAIDLPRVGEPVEGRFLEIAGWTVGRHSNVEAIGILHDSCWLTGVPVLLMRPDVARYLNLSDANLRSGFHVALNTIGLPETFELSVWAHLAGAPPVEFARVRGSHTQLRSPFRPALQPLSVTGLGRSGTTLLMRALAEHPEITVHRKFPYEMRLGAYWMHVLTVLSGPANHHFSSHPDRFPNERLSIGNNPYAHSPQATGPALRWWFDAEAPAGLAAFCQQNIDAAYLRIARDQGEAAGRYFTEKNHPSYTARLLSHVYEGAKEIFLVRDFRDVICSMQAFDGKRQTRDFQRDDADAEAFVFRTADEFRRLESAWNERRHSALLLRYEDLLAEPHASLRRVADYAGIDAAPAVIERMVDASREDDDKTLAHRTTGSGSQSVGRYRDDMNEDLRALCLEIGADLLGAFGYSTDDAVPAASRRRARELRASRAAGAAPVRA